MQAFQIMLMPMRRFVPFLKAVVVTAALLSFHSYGNAQVIAAVVPSPVDTTGKYLRDNPGFIVNNAPATASSLKDAALQQQLQLSIRKPADRKILMGRLREMNVDAGPEANHIKKKLFYNLAGAFARLKMYSLAMKCFFKSMQYNKTERAGIIPDSLENNSSVQPDSVNADIADPDERYLNFNDKDDTLLNKQAALLAPPIDKELRSPKITYEHIVETFKDGKKAVTYAMLIHVKQPVSGKPKVYHIIDTGHTFITLIKYNSDSTYVSLSFGFYPDKNHPLAATPLFPGSHSAFKNDNEHKWDEVAGKFITKRRFEKILALTKKYNGLKYHLSKNNCTDFSLNAALLAGISIDGTIGNWPLGHGNNPGVTGQSLLDGKLKDGGKSSPEDVFVNDTVRQ